MIYPMNRHLVVELKEQEKKESSSILIPDDVEVTDSNYCLVTLLEPHVDSKLKPGMVLVVPRHSLERVTVLDEEYYVVLENHITGFLGNNEF
tara:strand:+ start:6730 stop:7005 length:276 start_codon:yes stop_codon:yes gene_type:complete